jgi:hypothetical protein
MIVQKIISGGQTGADRGGLDAAGDLHIERGGWAPHGWRAEDGIIPEVYRVGMRETKSPTYKVRTVQNIMKSDGTLIISFGELSRDSGSMLTAITARKIGMPILHIMVAKAGEYVSPYTWQVASDWLNVNRIYCLNVAGPRESREPGIQVAARKALMCVLGPSR